MTKVICVQCGKEIDSTEGSYYGIYRPEIGNYAVAKLVDDKFVRCIKWYKYIYYKLVDYKRLLLKQYTEIELWFCKECEELEDSKENKIEHE